MRRNRPIALMLLLVIALMSQNLSTIKAADNNYGENGTSVLYVSVSGSDTTGDGTQANPWATLGYAASQASSGDTIHMSAGTYNIDSSVELPLGVSLEGDVPGNNEDLATILTTTIERELEDGGDHALVRLVSEGGVDIPKVNGNQHISYIHFYGARKGSQAIEIQNRNNVSIHDCVINDFKCIGVGWRSTGLLDVYDEAPTYFVTGGLFYNNYMKDNSYYVGYARGALFCGGLKDFEMYNNTIIEDCRTSITNDNLRGVPVKFWYYCGWMVGCKMHDNVIERLGSTVYSNEDNGWAFAIESRRHSGVEIYNNTFVGAVDLVEGFTGTYGGTKYSYATWIHDNEFIADPNPKENWGNVTYEQTAIILEGVSYKTTIEHNKITGYDGAIYFNVRDGVDDFTFEHNLCLEMGGPGAGSLFRLDGIYTYDSTQPIMGISEFIVKENVFESKSADVMGFGFDLGHVMDDWQGYNIKILGNVVANVAWNWIQIVNFSSLNQCSIKDNILYNVGDTVNVNPLDETFHLVINNNTEVNQEGYNAAKAVLVEYYNNCPNKPDTPVTYTVTFNTNGGSAIDSQTVESGQKATKPADPTKEGYTFEGWYVDANYSAEFNFDTAITEDTTIYAKWSEII